MFNHTVNLANERTKRYDVQTRGRMGDVADKALKVETAQQQMRMVMHMTVTSVEPANYSNAVW